MPPPSFEFGLVSLFYLGVKIGCLFELSFKHMHYQLYISLLVMFFRIPYIVVGSVDISVCLQVFSEFLFYYYYFLAYWLCKSVFNLHILWIFPPFLLLLTFRFIALWQETVPLHDLSLFIVDLFSGLTYGQFWRMFPVHLWKVWSLSVSVRVTRALGARFSGVTSHCREQLLGWVAIFMHY